MYPVISTTAEVNALPRCSILVSVANEESVWVYKPEQLNVEFMVDRFGPFKLVYSPGAPVPCVFCQDAEKKRDAQDRAAGSLVPTDSYLRSVSGDIPRFRDQLGRCFGCGSTTAEHKPGCLA